MSENANVKTSVVKITPDIATAWLEGNVHNRPIKDRIVREYAEEMKAGRWSLNGEAIIFDSDGSLANGQHRLWACVSSGVTFESVVVHNVKPAAFLTIDRGSRRSTGDALYISGAGKAKGINRNALAASALMIWKYRNDSLFGNLRVPASTLVDIVEGEPNLVEWSRRAHVFRGGLRGFATPVTACCFLASKGLLGKANEFFDRFEDGMNLGQGNPILALRARALTNPPNQGWERLFLVVSAWNAFASGRQLFKISAVPRSDEFPKIKGA